MASALSQMLGITQGKSRCWHLQHHRRRQHLWPPQLPLAHRPPGAVPAGRSFLQLAGWGDSTEPLSHGAGSWPWLAPAAADKGCTAAAQGNLSSPAASQSSLCTPQPTKAAAEPWRGRQKDPNFPLQPDTLQAAAARGVPLGRAQLPKPCNITYLTQPLLFVGSSGLSFFFFKRTEVLLLSHRPWHSQLIPTRLQGLLTTSLRIQITKKQYFSDLPCNQHSLKGWKKTYSAVKQ